MPEDQTKLDWGNRQNEVFSREAFVCRFADGAVKNLREVGALSVVVVVVVVVASV
jgi:hypothetical protein